jgi:hypothetical protein
MKDATSKRAELKVEAFQYWFSRKLHGHDEDLNRLQDARNVGFDRKVVLIYRAPTGYPGGQLRGRVRAVNERH